MTIEAMKLALEVLRQLHLCLPPAQRRMAADAGASLRTAIEEAEKAEPVDWEAVAADQAMTIALMKSGEPVAWMCSDENLVHKGYSRFSRTCDGDWNIPVYTAPPAAPVNEPVGMFSKFSSGVWKEVTPGSGGAVPLYTHPKEWVGLTEQEQGAIMEGLNAFGTRLYEFASTIEAKLKEKNS